MAKFVIFIDWNSWYFVYNAKKICKNSWKLIYVQAKKVQTFFCDLTNFFPRKFQKIFHEKIRDLFTFKLHIAKLLLIWWIFSCNIFWIFWGKYSWKFVYIYVIRAKFLLIWRFFFSIFHEKVRESLFTFKLMNTKLLSFWRVFFFLFSTDTSSQFSVDIVEVTPTSQTMELKEQQIINETNGKEIVLNASRLQVESEK